MQANGQCTLMRPERIDFARRTLLAALAETLAAAGLADDTRAAIEAELHELLDRFLYLLDAGEWDRRTGALVAEFTLMRVWPEIVRRLAPALAGDIEDAARLQRVLDARRGPVGPAARGEIGGAARLHGD